MRWNPRGFRESMLQVLVCTDTGFRDSFMQTVFCIDYSGDCQRILEMISNTDHWHTASVTVSEYSDFARNVIWGYENSWQYTDEIVFDAWYYRETAEPHIPNNRIPKGPMDQIGTYDSDNSSSACAVLYQILHRDPRKKSLLSTDKGDFLYPFLVTQAIYLRYDILRRRVIYASSIRKNGYYIMRR